MIKIVVCNSLDINGERYQKITNIKALGKDKLPKEYTDKAPYCFLLRNGDLYVKTEHSSFVLLVGDVLYSESRLASSLLVIRRAGERLQKINKKIRDREWCGIQVITI